MTNIALNPKVTFEVFLALTESEARALDALAGYGEDEFIKHFYDHLGRAYLDKHENGLRAFLASVRRRIPYQLQAVDRSRAALEAASGYEP